MRKTIAGAIVGAIIGTATVAGAGTTTTREVYAPKDGSGPRIVILGGGYASAEDSLGLRLVDFDPEHNRVIYRVVIP